MAMPIIPKPEPFAIKAEDKFAAATIAYWISKARMGGVKSEKLAKARQHLEELNAWQEAHRKLVKVPD